MRRETEGQSRERAVRASGERESPVCPLTVGLLDFAAQLRHLIVRQHGDTLHAAIVSPSLDFPIARLIWLVSVPLRTSFLYSSVRELGILGPPHRWAQFVEAQKNGRPCGWANRTAAQRKGQSPTSV